MDLIRRLRPWVALLLFSCSRTGAAAIFGPDARKEIFEDERATRLAPSTAIMVSDTLYKRKEGDRLEFDVDTMETSPSYHVCKDERFSNQPSAGVSCSGFLVGPDIIATAGHCMVYPRQEFNEVRNEVTPYCSTFSWLFDYQLQPDGTVDAKDVPADRLVRCKRVIHAVVRATKDPQTGKFAFGPDYALIQLERPLQRRALNFAKTEANTGDIVAKIGYPSGMPAKWTRAGVVIESEADYFRTTLDGVSGDSGSPVFNQNDEVVGILVRAFPENDYLYNDSAGCSRPNRCDVSLNRCDGGPPEYPMGSQIQRVAPIAAAVASPVSTN